MSVFKKKKKQNSGEGDETLTENVDQTSKLPQVTARQTKSSKTVMRASVSGDTEWFDGYFKGFFGPIKPLKKVEEKNLLLLLVEQNSTAEVSFNVENVIRNMKIDAECEVIVIEYSNKFRVFNSLKEYDKRELTNSCSDGLIFYDAIIEAIKYIKNYYGVEREISENLFYKTKKIYLAGIGSGKDTASTTDLSSIKKLMHKLLWNPDEVVTGKSSDAFVLETKYFAIDDSNVHTPMEIGFRQIAVLRPKF